MIRWFYDYEKTYLLLCLLLLLQAVQSGQNFYNKCSGLVDLAHLKATLGKGKDDLQQLKVADVEGLLAAACSNRENPNAVELFKGHLAEILPGSALETAAPAALLAEARRAVAEAATTEMEKPDKKRKNAK